MTRTDELSDYVCRLAAGDSAVLELLYDATNRAVYSLALRILQHPADAEEVTLDVYSQVWRQASRYDRARGDVIGWLLNMTRSRAIDRIRSHGARRVDHGLELMDAIADEAASPEESSALSQRARRVREALGRLSEEQRLVVELAYFEGLSHSEIAERTQLPLGTAKSRLRLAMAHLREWLEPVVGGRLA
ncbi:MAG: sigma-70 family RNA polymerase sigma factor [Acidobacteria bacterium]|nr:sigma-70 family RNA polymerase sigma factor [Acidobacteriota bacterium]